MRLHQLALVASLAMSVPAALVAQTNPTMGFMGNFGVRFDLRYFRAFGNNTDSLSTSNSVTTSGRTTTSTQIPNSKSQGPHPKLKSQSEVGWDLGFGIWTLGFRIC